MVDMTLYPTKPNLIYAIYMYKEDLAFNNLQRLICRYIQLNQILYMQYICIKRIWALNNLRWLICHKTKLNLYLSANCLH